jgi:predicted Zn-dependent peptidase
MYQKFVADNGLRILTETSPLFPSATVGIWVTGSTLEETDETRGLSHFVEHILFKGTATRSAQDIVTAVEAVGGYINAFTDREYACYYVKVLAEHTELAVDILCDMVSNPALRFEDIQLEKDVVIEEIKGWEDTPEDMVMDVFAETIWKDSPLGKNILGTTDTVGGFTPDTVRSFIQQHYTPDNVIVAAVGSIKHERIVDLVMQRLGHLQGQAHKSPNGVPVVQADVRLVPKKTEQVHFCVGTRGYSQDEANKYPASLLDTILGGGGSSRLFQEVREKRGLVYGIGTCSASYKPAGYFAVSASSTVKNAEKVARLVAKEFRDVKKSGVTEEELARAKAQYKGGVLMGQENSSTRLWRLARAEMYFGRFITVKEVLRDVEKVKLDDVARVAYEMFDDQLINVAAVGPFEEKTLDLTVSVQ